MFKKNDPLLDSVKSVMKENEARREAERKLNEELGIASKRALPFEHHANYDALLEQRISEALHPNQQKLDVHEPEKDKLTAQDFKMLRAKKNLAATKATFPNVKHTTKSGHPDWEKHGIKDIPTVKEEKALPGDGVQGSGTVTKNGKDVVSSTATKVTPMPPERPKDLKEENYHSSYTSAIQTAIAHAKKRGYEVDPDDYQNKVASGPRKPSEGKTVSHNIKLMKDGKPTKKGLAIQVYNRGGDKTPYELNHYISEEVNQIDEISRDLASRYIKKAKSSTRDAYYGDDAPTMGKRKKGIDLALKKKWGDKSYGTDEPKVKATNEESEQINEVSKKKVGDYIEKARKDIHNKKYDDDSEEGFRKVSNRSKGIERALDKRDSKSKVAANEETIEEKAPPGAKFERMVKHIKKGYGKDGLTKQEKSIAYATAWKAKNKEEMKEAIEAELRKNLGEEQLDEILDAIKGFFGAGKSAPEKPENRAPMPGEMGDNSDAPRAATPAPRAAPEKPENRAPMSGEAGDASAEKEADRVAATPAGKSDADVDKELRGIGKAATDSAPKSPTSQDIAKQTIRAPVTAAKGEGQVGKALAASGISRADRLNQDFVNRTLGANAPKAGSKEANMALQKYSSDMKRVASGGSTTPAAKPAATPAARPAAPMPPARPAATPAARPSTASNTGLRVPRPSPVVRGPDLAPPMNESLEDTIKKIIRD